jgi:predicted dehydrogenase
MDAVLIAAPIFLHHQVGIDSLRAGKHVLCEKPLAVSVKAGHRMVAEAQARGLSLAVAENVHYSPGLRIQKFLLDSGLIGRVQMWLSATMGAWLLSSMDAVFDDTPWRHRKLLSGGGFALDAGVHAFNQIRYLCGKIDQISAMAPCLEPRRYMRDADGQVIESVDSEVGDAYFAHLRFASGAVGAIMAGRAGHGEPTGLKDGTTIYGTKGCIKGGEVILDDGQRISGKTHFKDVAPVELKQSWFPRGLQDIFALEQLDFLQSVESAKEMETDGQEGLSDLACSFAVLESAALNQPVSVADVLSGSVDTYQQEVNKHYGL